MSHKKQPTPVEAPSPRRTFRSIDEEAGVYLNNLEGDGWPLEIWFAVVYEVPIEKLTVFDLARACRQHRVCENYLPTIVPICIALLEHDPLAGELYDGELLSAIIGLPEEYWSDRAEQRKVIEDMASTTFKTIEDNEYLKKQLSRFLGH